MIADETPPVSPRPSPRQTLPKRARICTRRDFDRVFREKNRASDGLLTVYLGRNEVGMARLGIAAGRALGKAVTRNRIKRLVREAFRRYRTDLPPGTDWIVVPRQAGASLREIDASLRRLTERLLRRTEG
ncbi:MAG TPA: ribonuclease P protein component [Phycisphaerae bacterium]|jgi:ribonuclease P protein component|nr:ribonuclease P protein component [Phycisphaerae bacterium]HOB76720.1 ribonuclease P protein component [Phycisphaerae bacterium]HOJ56761.1 ribonuclease P protein component [Phycisphaerae bacterium]HOL28506.1 ribonuclease P protein component [Phycisphaerae bacterium]HPP23031.1 ribonuclease P protein component [Phycisphaerae bacterium]